VKRCLVSCLLACLAGPVAVGQTTLPGVALSMRSLNSAALTENGYVGTYIDVANDGDDVTISVNASGTPYGGIDPHMNIVLADYSTGWDVGSASNDYSHTFTDLPAGKYFLRTEFNNNTEHSSRELDVNSLTVTGATLSNTNNSTINNANALAAADTYINNFRKGNVSVSLPGLSPGTPVEVSLKNHAFNFGTAVAGNNGSTLMAPNPSPGSDAYKYQDALKNLFNALVPENAGKWQQDENTRDVQSSPQLDRIVAFADANDKRLRMHNLIWGNQQPGWVNTMLNNPNGTDAVTGLSNKQALRDEISERIDYYVGDGVGDDPANHYSELDVYNESYHTTQYWNIYHADGVADIYNEVADAVQNAGADVHLYTNEYNVLQDGGDQYGNWYKQNIESILAEGGAVSGIGVQSYENNSIGTGNSSHYPARQMQTLQNLSVLGMPITLTEFGVKDPTSSSDATTMLDDAVRLVFGTPNATGFFMWGFWRGDIYRGAAALYDANWNLTEAGQRWIDLQNEWDTQFTGENALLVGPDGKINFDGFWGDYDLTINGETYDLDLLKGTTDYLLATVPVLEGDYDGNGVIDAADYTAWRDALTAGATTLLNDPTPGTVDESDFYYWRDHFGETLEDGAGAGSAAAVPEPAGALLLLLGSLALAVAARR
jgi:GH35 family endo-1,4-beta-xylanase